MVFGNSVDLQQNYKKRSDSPEMFKKILNEFALWLSLDVNTENGHDDY